VPWGRHADDDSVLRRLWSRVGDVFRVKRLVRRTTFDVLVVKTSHEWVSLVRDLPLLLATRRSSPCTVLQFHGGDSLRLVAPGASLFKAASWALLRLCDGVLLLSSEEARAASQFNPRGTFRVVINPFQPAFDSTRRAVRASEPGRRSTILFVGRLIPEKGVFDVIEAAAAVRRRLAIRTVVAGGGPAASELERRAQELGLGLEDVLFTGEIDHDRLQELYETSDVFVLPTYWGEGFPTVISEAMNAGLPIVTTRMRGMADHLQEDENALFVAPRAPEKLALTVERLLRDPDLRTRMGRANQEKVKLFAPA
jgi:glycosyltransferase involved in cell wall biosynthesis